MSDETRPGVVERMFSPRRVLLAAALLLVLVEMTDLALNPSFVVLTVFLGLSPLLAAAALGPLRTAVFAVAGVALAALSYAWNGGGSQFVVRLVDVAAVGAVAVLVAAIRASRESALDTSLRIASVAQQALLPVIPHHIGNTELATRYHSATRMAQVGGDFYDWVFDQGRTRLILGDVSGKGVDAVTQAARVIRAFRQYASSETDLVSVARRIDEYVVLFWEWDYFATAVLIELNEGSDSLRVVSAGHPPPLHARGNAVSTLEVIPCLPLGLGPAGAASEHSWRIADRLLLYTDGLIEARNQSREFLPPEAIEAALRATDIDAALDALLNAVQTHANEFDDDLALMCLEYLDPLAGPKPGARDHGPA